MVSIREALQKVADNPEYTPDVLIDAPVHELVARTLFDIANSPDTKVRGSLSRATRAQKMIMDRLVGLRKAGTNPVAQGEAGIEFVDLTRGVLE